MTRPKLHKAIRIALFAGLAALVASGALVRWGNDMARAFENDRPSRSIGSTADGSLINGKRLPMSGANFRGYSRVLTAVGRNSLHGEVRAVVLDAYAMLAEARPDLTFVCGECSWPSGGQLRPHVTHRNGLSIDFMVPVKSDGTSTFLKDRYQEQVWLRS